MPEEYINLKTGKRNRKRMERENRIEGILTHFERQYLGIYGLQSIVLQRIFANYIHVNKTLISDWQLDFFIVPFIGFISVLLCHALIQILKRSRPLDFLLFGNQY